MNIAFTIPWWALWILGAVVGVCLLGLAALGVMFLIAMRDFNRSMTRWWGW